MDFNDLKGMFGEVKTRMDGAIDRVRKEMASVRTGRATVSLLDGVQVDAYGSRMPINQVATLSVPEPALIVAQPFDPSTMKEIEKAIRSSDLGLNPSNDGKVIRIPIPPLTGERRKERVKVVKTRAEDGRVAVRNVRRDARKELEALEKAGEISRDELDRVEKDLEKAVAEVIAEIDEMVTHKERELLEV